ncbi:hypothetical protein SBY92_004416 [Candida maltosa Xu316]
MVLKKDNKRGTNSKISKSKKKSSTSIPSKSKSKSTKIKIDKLNKDISEFNEVQHLLAENDGKKSTAKPKVTKALDSIKEDLRKDEELKQKNKLAEKDLNKQLELLTEMGL